MSFATEFQWCTDYKNPKHFGNNPPTNNSQPSFAESETTA